MIYLSIEYPIYLFNNVQRLEMSDNFEQQLKELCQKHEQETKSIIQLSYTKYGCDEKIIVNSFNERQIKITLDLKEYYANNNILYWKQYYDCCNNALYNSIKVDYITLDELKSLGGIHISMSNLQKKFEYDFELTFDNKKRVCVSYHIDYHNYMSFPIGTFEFV